VFAVELVVPSTVYCPVSHRLYVQQLIGGYLVDLLYTPVLPCIEPFVVPPPFISCESYYNSTADDLRSKATYLAVGCVGTIVLALVGNWMFISGFGFIADGINKRIRILVFRSLIGQEVAFFDTIPVSALTSQLEKDTELVHAFVGNPLKAVTKNGAMVITGVVTSLVYMW